MYVSLDTHGMLRTRQLQLRDAPITSLMHPDNSHHTKILHPLFLNERAHLCASEMCDEQFRSETRTQQIQTYLQNASKSVFYFT